MVKSRLSSSMIATVALLSSATAFSTTPGSGFVSSDGGISFALNIPQADDNDDLYFTMSGSASSSWIAIGMGSENMKNSLIFMAYSDSSGNNITLSPRLVYGEVEPEYTSSISVSVLPGSGIANETMTVNAMCSRCRSWKGGSIDPTNTAAQFIFAIGPDGNLKTNSLSADTRRHEEYGSFTMDLTKAVGVKGVPVAMTADTAGTTQDSLKTDHNFSAPLHACIMILAFVALMPFGVMVLRIFKSPKWHGITQATSAVMALVGAGLGIYISLMYNRSKKFNSAHQIFGLIIITALLAQTVVGFLHHKKHKATQSPTKLSRPHVWLGRLLIPCGIINGFLGFPLALNSKFNWALMTLVLLVVIVVGPFALWRYKRDNQKKLNGMSTEEGGTGYQAQPWVSGNSSAAQSQIQLGAMNQGYPPTHAYSNYGQAPEQGRQFV